MGLRLLAAVGRWATWVALAPESPTPQREHRGPTVIVLAESTS